MHGPQARLVLLTESKVANNHHASLPIAYRLYLPEAWAEYAERRKKARIPEEIAFRTKPEIALEQIPRSGCGGRGASARFPSGWPLWGVLAHTYAVSSGCRNQRQRRVSSISERMVNGWRTTSCSMTRAAIRPTPLVLRRL